MSNLFDKSTNLKGRYKKAKTSILSVGDIVLLKEPLTKPQNYPLAIITKFSKNEMNEVTDITARKGCTGEVVSRHVNAVIPLLSSELNSFNPNKTSSIPRIEASSTRSRPGSGRVAAAKCRKKTLDLVKKGVL